MLASVSSHVGGRSGDFSAHEKQHEFWHEHEFSHEQHGILQCMIFCLSEHVERVQVGRLAMNAIFFRAYDLFRTRPDFGAQGSLRVCE